MPNIGREPGKQKCPTQIWVVFPRRAVGKLVQSMRDKPPNARVRTKRRLLFSGIAAAVVLAAALLHQLASRGPSYQGKSIEYWFKKAPLRKWDEMGETFRKIGPVAVPYLRKMLREDTWWEGFYRSQYKRLPPWLRQKLAAPPPPGQRQIAAAWMLAYIGPQPRRQYQI